MIEFNVDWFLLLLLLYHKFYNIIKLFLYYLHTTESIYSSNTKFTFNLAI